MKTKLLSLFSLAASLTLCHGQKVTLEDTIKLSGESNFIVLRSPVLMKTNDPLPIVICTKTISITNWSDSPISSTTAMAWSGGVDPNIVTRYENGIVQRQTVVEFLWKGAVKTAVLEESPTAFLTRSYRVVTKTERVY